MDGTLTYKETSLQLKSRYMVSWYNPLLISGKVTAFLAYASVQGDVFDRIKGSTKTEEKSS